MPKPKPAPRPAFPTLEVTKVELSQVLGIHHQGVTALQNSGVLVPRANGMFHLTESVQAWAQSLMPDGADAERDNIRIEKDRADLAYKQAQAEFQQRKNAVFAGQFIARADVEVSLSPVIADFTEHLRAGFEREFPAWAVGKSAPAIKAECQARLDAALLRVRNGCIDALDTAEAKATGGMASDDQGEQPEVLRTGRPRDPNSRRSKRARRHATEGKPASGRKAKQKD